MENYEELILLCDYWIGLSDENDKKTMTDQLIERCKCAIEHLYKEYKILEWQNHLERCEHQRAKDYIVKLQEQLSKATKERNAMLDDLKKYAKCECCKYINGYVDDEPCNSCVGGYSRNFEWRGVQE